MANHPNETSDAGTEGLRLGYSTVRQADKTIRTAQRTIGLNEIPYAEWIEMTITGFEKNEEIP